MRITPLLLIFLGITIGVLATQPEITQKIQSKIKQEQPVRKTAKKVTLRKLALNPDKYEGKQVTFTGEFQSQFNPIKLTNGAYNVKLYKCIKKYNIELDYGDKLKITGVMVNPPNNDQGHLVQCGKPPKQIN